MHPAVADRSEGSRRRRPCHIVTMPCHHVVMSAASAPAVSIFMITHVAPLVHGRQGAGEIPRARGARERVVRRARGARRAVRGAKSRRDPARAQHL